MKHNPILQYAVNPELDTHVHEGILLNVLNNLFDVHIFILNSQKKTALKYDGTGSHMEVDAFIPNFNLAFEFQRNMQEEAEIQRKNNNKITGFLSLCDHVVSSSASPQCFSQRVNEKKITAQKKGLSLIIVPCWWDGSIESLKATIHFQRPDVIKNENYNPIPLNPPFNYFTGTDIPDVGELMLASFPVMNSVNIYDNSWWIGEKYDGVRFCWNPNHAQIYTRTGREISTVSNSFVNHLPSVYLDGEIWFGRGNYVYSFMLVKSVDSNVMWNLLRMLPFDVPVDGGVIEKRYHKILNNTEKNHPFIIIPTRLSFKSGRVELPKIVNGIIEEGGEGAILQKIRSHYNHGRTTSLLKLKTTQSDKEAIVIQKSSKEVTLKMANGTIFKVGNENILVNKISTGDVVTFAFNGYYKNEIPVGPKIYRIRTDLSWGDVISNYEKEKRQLNDHSNVEGISEKISRKGLWGSKVMRRVMENFSREKGLDPLLLDSWYSIPLNQMLLHPGINSILKKFKGQIIYALRHLFPELNLEKDSKGVVATRRKIFEKYAKENEFDPLIPGNWYAQSRKKILKYPGVFRAIFYHNQIVSKTIMDLFPNIGLEKSKFNLDSKWGDVQKRRNFFENYAKEKNFDPYDPANWYTQARDNIIHYKGGQGVMYHYKGNLPFALMDCFPNIGLEKQNFVSTSFWKDRKNRRNFFENYAKENGFDPLVPDNWYKHPYINISQIKGAKQVLIYHGFNVRKALIELFPEINFQISKLKGPPGADCWEIQENRRAVFEKFAKENNFDPLDYKQWYNQSRDKIMAIKGINIILEHHEKRISKALYDLFPEIGFPSPLFRFRYKK